MTWKLHDPEKAQLLENKFANLKIDSAQPGFCDHKNFLLAEQNNRRILEEYAQYVEVKTYTQTYLDDARRKIEVAAEAVRAAIEADERLGACVDASGILGRMLDRLGVWNYVAKSCLTISYPAASGLATTYFYAIDENEFSAPHAIVVAPPFYAVDVTAKYQPYETNKYASYLSPKTLLDEFKPVTWSDTDIIAPEAVALLKAQGISIPEYLRRNYRSMFDVVNKLPARQLSSSNGTSLKYTIIAVGGFIEQLEDITCYKPSGRTALEIFNEDVLPQL